MALVLVKSKLFKAVGYRPHDSQKLVHASTARHRLVCAGRRFGKSELGGHEQTVDTAALSYMHKNIDKRRPALWWIIGPEYSDSENEFAIVYDDFRRIDAPFDRPGTYNDPHSGDMQISLFDGKLQIIAKSSKHPERLVGKGLRGALMVEAAKMKPTVWSKYVRPALADYQGSSLHISTPEGKNWFYQNWQRGQDPAQPDWASWRFPSWANKYVYGLGVNDPEIVSLRNDLSTEEFNQEEAALFTEFAGRVFKGFDEELHVTDLTFDPAMETYAAVDHGFTNPFVWLLLQCDWEGNTYVIDEFYQRELDIREAAREVVDRGLAPRSCAAIYPDPASPGDSKILADITKIPTRGGTGGPLKDRLAMIRAALKLRPEYLPDSHPDKRPRLFINRRCINTIREFNDYRYPKSAAEAAEVGNVPELPLAKDNHTPEALGRYFAGRFGRGAHAAARSSEGSYE